MHFASSIKLVSNPLACDATVPKIVTAVKREK